jgi:RecA/RadA recombinase
MCQDKHGQQAAGFDSSWASVLLRQGEARLTELSGFETMSISEIYGEFRMLDTTLVMRLY